MRPAKRYSSASPLKVIPALIFLILVGTIFVRGALLYKDSKFGKFDRFNVVLVTKQLTLLSVDLRSHSAVEIRFPDDLYVSELAYGYGAYRASAIYSVGQLDHRGGETAAATVSDYLGIPVDGYIFDSGNLPKDIKNFFFSPNHLISGQSNLNLFDRASLAWTILQTRFDKINVVDLASFAEQLVLSDGSTALSSDKESVDNKLQGDFVEEKVRDEGLRLEVNNSTNVVGLGNRAGRILTNIGANVVSVGSSEVQLSQCQVQATAKARASLTVARVVAIFSCQLLPNIEEGRSEVVVTLGQDYAKMLGK